MTSSTVKTPSAGESASAMAAYADGSVREDKQQLRDLLTKSGVADEGADAMLSDEIIDLAARLKERGFPVHTITFDNGKEFARHEEISLQLNTLCFFAKPYHSWERRLNEHTNGLVRKYFPKYTNIAMLLPEEVKNAENLLNNGPRKILNFQTPNEVIQDATR